MYSEAKSVDKRLLPRHSISARHWRWYRLQVTVSINLEHQPCQLGKKAHESYRLGAVVLYTSSLMLVA